MFQQCLIIALGAFAVWMLLSLRDRRSPHERFLDDIGIGDKHAQ
jgi:hypothetical protein